MRKYSASAEQKAQPNTEKPKQPPGHEHLLTAAGSFKVTTVVLMVTRLPLLVLSPVPRWARHIPKSGTIRCALGPPHTQ